MEGDLTMRRPHRTDTEIRANERYDYPAKRAVRAHLVPFFTARTAPSAAERASVWFFPGSHHAEIDGYRGIGIPVGQLRAFEWNGSVARAISAHAPGLPLYRGALGSFLRDPRHRTEHCDLANLDFDGSALTFREEISDVVARMRTDELPRLAVTSFASRDHTVLIESTIAASALRAIAPSQFRLGADLAVVGNEHMGLAMRDRQSWLATAREFAVYGIILRAFGGRSYGPHDDAAAAAFRTAFDTAYAAFQASVRPRAVEALATARGLPIVESLALQRAVAARSIPLWFEDSLRFAYRTMSKRWMWTWMFRFAPTNGRPVGLLEWAERLLTMAPPLHVVSHTGYPVRGASTGVCTWCPREIDADART